MCIRVVTIAQLRNILCDCAIIATWRWGLVCKTYRNCMCKQLRTYTQTTRLCNKVMYTNKHKHTQTCMSICAGIIHTELTIGPLSFGGHNQTYITGGSHVSVYTVTLWTDSLSRHTDCLVLIKYYVTRYLPIIYVPIQMVSVETRCHWNKWMANKLSQNNLYSLPSLHPHTPTNTHTLPPIHTMRQHTHTSVMPLQLDKSRQHC